jgi:tRNA A37 N6-isopentenylltransferase MiaA
LVYLKYTFQFRSQFDERNDDWLDTIEATSDELLGAYSRAEDKAMTAAFGARRKKRLNRVFDVIGFVYRVYSFSVQRREKKESRCFDIFWCAEGKENQGLDM